MEGEKVVNLEDYKKNKKEEGIEVNPDKLTDKEIKEILDPKDGEGNNEPHLD